MTTSVAREYHNLAIGTRWLNNCGRSAPAWHASPTHVFSQSTYAKTHRQSIRMTYNARSFRWIKVKVVYSVVSSPLDRSKRFTLFLPWQTCSLRHQLGFSRKHSSYAAITRNDYSLTFPPLSIARYSFIQLGELGVNGENNP